jgi:alpha-N-arabinofuranosidase
MKFVASGPNQDDVAWTSKFFESTLHDRPIPPPWGLSLHYYTDLPEALKFTDADVYPAYAKADRMERVINDHWSAMGVYDPTHRVKLVVDEYGPWYRMGTEVDPSHIFGEQITMRDAIMSALTLDIFMRNAEKVGMAACAQLINCINSLFLAHEEKFINTPNYYVFEMYAAHQGGQAVRTEFSAPGITYKGQGEARGPWDESVTEKDGALWGLNGSASMKGKNVTITITNPHLTDARDTEVVLRGAGSVASVEATVLTADEIHAHNTFDQPDAVTAKKAQATASGRTVKVTLPPSSVVKLEVVIS